MMLLHSFGGFFAFALIAWLLSERRHQVAWRDIGAGLVLQWLLAALLFNLPGLQSLFLGLNQWVMALDAAATAGTAFVFGYLGGGDAPFTATYPENSFILAFKALPLVLVISALSALLFYWRILPWVVRGFSWLLQKTLHTGGALGLGAAANIFIGMTEAPLLIRPYLQQLTRSELFALMTTGMATIAGTVLVLYASILSAVFPEALGHLLIASVLSAPAALTVARLLVPETASPTGGDWVPDAGVASSMDAVTQGTLEGLKLLLNIVALLIVFVALVHLGNQLLALLPVGGDTPLSLQKILGWLMAPVVWLMGIPWSEAGSAGELMGIKTVLNEFLAYLQLAQNEDLSERSRLIMMYALCGFANLGSLGIMIGGLSALAPERRAEIAALGVKSILGGTLATCMTGALVGVFF